MRNYAEIYPGPVDIDNVPPHCKGHMVVMLNGKRISDVSKCDPGAGWLECTDAEGKTKRRTGEARMELVIDGEVVHREVRSLVTCWVNLP